MKKRFLAALATGLLVVGMGGVAQALIITPGGLLQIASGLGTSETGTDKILSDIEDLISGFDKDNELYKSDVDSALESGPFKLYYDTEYSSSDTDPSDALITHSGTSWITNPGFLFVKDGNHQPIWYLFDISSWNGQENLDLQDFWPNGGAISHVAIYGGDPVPEPATMLLFGTGLAGLAGIARRRKKTNA